MKQKLGLRNPVAIYEQGIVVHRWLDCEFYNLCLDEISELRFPSTPISWTCEECSVFKLADGLVLTFGAGKPKAFGLRELWEHIWEKDGGD